MKNKMTNREVVKIVFVVIMLSMPFIPAWIAAEMGKELELLICLTLCIVTMIGIPMIYIVFLLSKIFDKLGDVDKKSV